MSKSSLKKVTFKLHVSRLQVKVNSTLVFLLLLGKTSVIGLVKFF